MSYRIAKSLDKLRSQINALAPNRNKASDGWIGDAAHASRSSDHNPWIKDGSVGVVTALDITHDPVAGVDCNKLVQDLIKDKRTKYVIWNKQIYNPSVAKQWRPYTGSNPHTKHFHLSVSSTKSLYDDESLWKFDIKAPIIMPETVVKSKPLLKQGSKGEDVKHLQTLLGITVDGDFGPKTAKAVKDFQTKVKLTADGIVGPYTYEALESKPVEEVIKPVENSSKIFVYILYGLGGRIFSSGMEDVLAASIRQAVKNVVCPPARGFSEWKDIVDEIKKQPKESYTVVVGHSMGASSATYVTDLVPVDLLVLYDLAGLAPSKIGKNTSKCIDIYDTIADVVPEWRVQPVSEEYANRIVRWTSQYGHTGQDDSIDLAKKVIAEIILLKE